MVNKQLNIKEVLNTKLPYIIAETAFAHEGNKNYLLKQVDEISKSYADSIKFQILLDRNEFLDSIHPLFSTINKWTFDADFWKSILKKAKSHELEVIVAPLDMKSLLLLKNNCDFIDAVQIHPSLINDFNFIPEVLNITKEKNMVLIVSIGGMDLNELVNLSENIRSKKIKDVLFMYGFQNYPTNIDELNLDRIPLLTKLTKFPIGFADHTHFEDRVKKDIIITSYTLGSNVQEIHHVIDLADERTDQIAAYSNYEFSEIKKDLFRIYNARGKPNFLLTEGEKNYRKNRKIPFYKIDISVGEKLKYEHLIFKRTKFVSTDIVDSSELLRKFIGKKLKRNVSRNRQVLITDFYR